MSDLAIEVLQANIEKILEYSIDNRFSQEQRTQWEIQGLGMAERLKQLVNAKIDKKADSDILRANQQLKIINNRLANEMASLNNFSDTIKKINDAVSILDTIIGLIV